MKNLLPPFPVYERIRLLRLFSGLSQVDMAKLLKGSQAWLSKVESGKLEISAQHLFLLRSVFGISSDAILDGVIPYYEVALRMNSEVLLPEVYSHEARTPIKVLYPVITALQQNKNKILLPAITRQLKIKPFLFADPGLTVNEAFLKDFLTHAKMVDFFDSKASFEILKKDIMKGYAQVSTKSLGAHAKYNDQFVNEWVELSKLAPKNNDLSSGLLAGAQKPVFRSKAIRVG